LEESYCVCSRWDEKMVDAIEVSERRAGQSEMGTSAAPASRRPGEGRLVLRPNAPKIAYGVESPVVLVGGIRSVEVMEEILNETDILLSFPVPAVLCEPDLANRWKSGDLEKSRCNFCKQMPGRQRQPVYFQKIKTRRRTRFAAVSFSTHSVGEGIECIEAVPSDLSSVSKSSRITALGGRWSEEA
jgi:2,4-dienoyl-CoA reductase-like NADH-dependent reductase (Old Yellow Enzyme family)